MFVADLSEIEIIAADVPVRAVGWLDREHSFLQSPVAEDLYRRLLELFRDPWQPFVTAGVHSCDLCHFVPEAHGNKNLFVLADSAIYCCPELICHYINAHGYHPPDEFCAAVLACPDTRSMEYKRLLIKLGVVRRLGDKTVSI